MMNDRFSSQLRQHLLGTAEERAADGQLTAVLDRLAVTAQRHPLVARLTWFPGRIGPFPSTGVRYGLVALALLLATVVAAVLIGGSTRPPSTVFEGTWTSTDPADGSAQSLVVGVGATPPVRFVDHFASGDACVSDAVKVFTADGTGKVTGNRLDIHWPAGGGCGLMTVKMGDGTYLYNDSTNTIVDGQQLIWTRVQGAAAPPTRAPLPQQPATQTTTTEPPRTEPSTSDPLVASATPVPGCIDFTGGGTYQASAGSLSLTVTVPALADARWVGLRDSFHLERAPCGVGGSANVQVSLVDQVYVDACHWRDAAVEAGTPAAASAAVAAQTGHVTSGPVATTLAGSPATRLEISVPAEFDATTCSDGMIQLWDGMSIDPGQTKTVYLVGLGGATGAVTATRWDADATPALLAELDSIVSSLRVGP